MKYGWTLELLRDLPSITTDEQGIVRASGMGEVVIYLMQTVYGKAGQSPLELFDQYLTREDPLVLLGRNWKPTSTQTFGRYDPQASQSSTAGTI